MDRKALSLPILISMVVGNMIGTGIFVLPASLANYGTISLVSWVFTSLGALLLALTFTHLNKRYPKTGGPYAYCRQAFGRLVGFIIAVIYWFSNLVSIAGLTLASIGYLGFVFPALNANTPGYDPTYNLVLELAAIWFFTFINMRGIHFAGVVQLFLTIIKITPLIVIVIFGLSHMQLVNLTQFSVNNMSHFSAISGAAALTFWAFVGLEAATVPAENTRGPRDIAKATIYGTLIASLIYITSTLVLMGMIPVSELKNSQFPFAEAGATLFGPFGALIIALLACISGFGALNVCILLQGQIVFSAARDNIFPHWLAKLTKHDVPIRGLLLSSTLVSLLLIVTMQPTLLTQFNFIVLLAALLSLITYLASTFAEIKFLFQEKGSLSQLLRKPSTIVSMLAAIYTIWMIWSMNAVTIKIAFLLILLCVPLYYLFIYRRTHQRAS